MWRIFLSPISSGENARRRASGDGTSLPRIRLIPRHRRTWCVSPDECGAHVRCVRAIPGEEARRRIRDGRLCPEHVCPRHRRRGASPDECGAHVRCVRAIPGEEARRRFRGRTSLPKMRLCPAPTARCVSRWGGAHVRCVRAIPGEEARHRFRDGRSSRNASVPGTDGACVSSCGGHLD
jgi:hypothetical protein